MRKCSFFLFCWVHPTVQWVCFSNPSSFYLKLLLFPSEQDFTLSFPPPSDKQDRYFGFADVCRGAIVFFPVCHFLPLHPTSPQNAASCPSLVASEVPPSPSGMAQDFTISLSNIQEVRQTTCRQHVAGPGRCPKCMLWKWLEWNRSIWCVRFMLS